MCVDNEELRETVKVAYLQTAGEPAGVTSQGPVQVNHFRLEIIKNLHVKWPQGTTTISCETIGVLHCIVNFLPQTVL
jgi:hypothetical protein